MAGYGDNPANLGVKKYLKNFAPRTGISYRMTETSVVRAGYGISTIPFPDNSYAATERVVRFGLRVAF